MTGTYLEYRRRHRWWNCTLSNAGLLALLVLLILFARAPL